MNEIYNKLKFDLLRRTVNDVKQGSFSYSFLDTINKGTFDLITTNNRSTKDSILFDILDALYTNFVISNELFYILYDRFGEDVVYDIWVNYLKKTILKSTYLT